MTAAELVRACRLPDTIQPGERGLWILRALRMTDGDGSDAGLHAGDRYAALCRLTDATIHVGGECVMEDTPRELRRHLPILLPARGRVLVSGLGLGCVVRGLLAKPEVEHVDVVEIDPHVAELVWPQIRSDFDPRRVRLHMGDALEYEWPEGTRWDFAWHDVWSETEALPLVHARLMRRYQDMAPRQGCWQLPRELRRALRAGGFPLLEGLAA